MLFAYHKVILDRKVLSPFVVFLVLFHKALMLKPDKNELFFQFYKF